MLLLKCRISLNFMLIPKKKNAYNPYMHTYICAHMYVSMRVCVSLSLSVIIIAITNAI